MYSQDNFLNKVRLTNAASVSSDGNQVDVNFLDFENAVNIVSHSRSSMVYMCKCQLDLSFSQ